jgi:ketosteroid isomerase-like protein
MSADDRREILRTAYDAFNRGDWEAAVQFTHPDVVWFFVGEGLGGIDTPRRIQGADEIRRTWATFFGVWDHWEMAPGEFEEGAGGTFLIPVRFTAEGHGSGVPIDLVFFQVVTFRSGLVESIGNYTEEANAREAAGLA